MPLRPHIQAKKTADRQRILEAAAAKTVAIQKARLSSLPSRNRARAVLARQNQKVKE